VARSIGLVVVDVTGVSDPRRIGRAIQRGVCATPIGRHLAAIFELPRSWETGRDVEAEICAQILPRADARDDGAEWEYFGTVVVRVCGPSGGDRNVEREMASAVFRKRGPKPYERRWSMSTRQAGAARLDVLHPVFTRDVANNVWHLWGDNPTDEVVRRMAHLMTWPDEDTLVTTYRSSKRLARRSPRLDSALIGVPTKRTYAWRCAHLELIFDTPARRQRGPGR